MAVQILQKKQSMGGGVERYPWPIKAASLQSAKSQLNMWLKKVAQHWQMETAPKFEWHAKHSSEIAFGTGTDEWVIYSFELVEER